MLTCNVGDLAVGASKTYSVSAVTSKADCGDIDNTATATATNEKAADEGNNSDTGSDHRQVRRHRDRQGLGDDAQVNAGDDIGFTVHRASTPATATAYNVIASDTLKSAFTWTLGPEHGLEPHRQPAQLLGRPVAPRRLLERPRITPPRPPSSAAS